MHKTLIAKLSTVKIIIIIGFGCATGLLIEKKVTQVGRIRFCINQKKMISILNIKLSSNVDTLAAIN